MLDEFIFHGHENRKEYRIFILSDFSECMALVGAGELDIVSLIALAVESAISGPTLRRTLLMPTLATGNIIGCIGDGVSLSDEAQRRLLERSQR